MAEITVNDQGYVITPPAGKKLSLNGVQVVKISETVLYSQFTDGGGAVGTKTLSGLIPVGATVLYAAIKRVVGFAGDVSAALTIGDGSDVDRYNTSTINVFSSAAAGVATGIASGTKYHAAAINPVLTITTNADFTSVSAGALDIEIVYMI